MIECDVAIVGAGPAGCAAARECATRGLRVVMVEKKKIPRHKACSGILVPDAINTLRKNFSELPQHVLADPPYIHAMLMHFPDGSVGRIPIEGTMVWRDRLDAWLCSASGAEVIDGTTMQSFSESDEGVTLRCVQKDGKVVFVHSKISIVADGGSSGVVKTIEPALAAKLPWYVALQDTYSGVCSLEPGFFHFFAHPEISSYPAAYIKDGLLVMDVVVRMGDRATAAMARFRNFLWKRFDAENIQRIRRLGCRVTYAAPRGSFCFGTNRMLVAGEASGLLNIFGEGISSALSSGSIAGKAAANSIQKNMLAGMLYRRDVEKERRKTEGTFHYRNLLFKEGNAFDFKKGLRDLQWKDRFIFYGNLLKWYMALKGKAS